MNQTVYLIGLNHRTAGVEIREKFALSDCNPLEAELFPLGNGVDEIMVLSTCNRVEILAVGVDTGIASSEEHTVHRVLELWAGARDADIEDLRPYAYVYKGLDAVRHLFKVAASLDSMVLGEPQILGQLKGAYRNAIQHGATRVILNRLLHKAFSVAKRVRTETAVASSAVSISYAAVELAKRIFGDMAGNRAMLVGAGEMAELAALHLVNAGIDKVYVANRTYTRAEELAAQFRGEPILFDDFPRRLVDVDIVISSTGAQNAVIRAKDVKGVLKKRRNRPMFFIDIAVPRDIDPDVNALDNVYLYDIDDLKEVVEENLAQRREEADKAEAIVESETGAFEQWLKALDLQPTIVDLLQQGEEIANKELEKTLKRLDHVDPATRQALEVMVRTTARKIFHEPICFLKRRSREEDSVRRYIDYTRRLFNLDNDVPPPDAHADRRTGLGADDLPDDVDTLGEFDAIDNDLICRDAGLDKE